MIKMKKTRLFGLLIISVRIPRQNQVEFYHTISCRNEEYFFSVFSQYLSCDQNVLAATGMAHPYHNPLDRTDDAGVSLRFYSIVATIIQSQIAWRSKSFSGWDTNEAAVILVDRIISGDKISVSTHNFIESHAKVLHGRLFSYITTPTGVPLLSDKICKELNGKCLFILHTFSLTARIV